MSLSLATLFQTDLNLYVCVAGVFTVLRKQGAMCVFKSVENPHLHLAINSRSQLSAVCALITLLGSLKYIIKPPPT